MRRVVGRLRPLYLFDGKRVEPVYKDFSPLRHTAEAHPILPRSMAHGIGAIYGAVSRYVFGASFAEGKLMGLAPYGTPGRFDFPIFDLRDGRVFVRYDWQSPVPGTVRVRPAPWATAASSPTRSASSYATT